MVYSRYFEQFCKISLENVALTVEISQEELETIPVIFLALPGIGCIVFLLKGVYLLYGQSRK
ncbi:hypothetical protein, partial [Desulfocastanea catecholica]